MRQRGVGDLVFFTTSIITFLEMPFHQISGLMKGNAIFRKGWEYSGKKWVLLSFSTQ